MDGIVADRLRHTPCSRAACTGRYWSAGHVGAPPGAADPAVVRSSAAGGLPPARGCPRGPSRPAAPISGWPARTSSLPRSRPTMHNGASSDPANRIGSLGSRPTAVDRLVDRELGALGLPPDRLDQLGNALGSEHNLCKSGVTAGATIRDVSTRRLRRIRRATTVRVWSVSRESRRSATNRSASSCPTGRVDRWSQGPMAKLMTRIFIYDTTLRDGSQGEGVNFSLQDKLLITARLDEAGIRLYRGRLSALQPQGRRLFPRGPRPGSEARQGRRLRHDPAPRRRRRGRSGHEGPGRAPGRPRSPSSARAGTCTSTMSSASRSTRTCG